MATYKGSCLCGLVNYEIQGEPKRFYHCHCKRCRKASGTGHATNLMLHAEAIQWLSGEHLITRYKLPEAERFSNHFCSHCGGRVPRLLDDLKVVVIPAGSLDSEIDDSPQARIFWSSRVPWSCSGDSVPVYDELPND